MNSPNLDLQEDPATQDTEDTSLRAVLESVNIAKNLSEERLKEIGSNAKKGYDDDKQSRAEWEKAVDEWTKLAAQHREDKSFPWPNASNVKYPLLTTAAMQFAARAYPSLVPSDGRIVKSQPIGKDPTGEKLAQADRVSTYMSWQIMREMECWEEQMDKLLIMLPIVGCVFKKTYFDTSEGKTYSLVIPPKDLVVNYWTRDLASAERVSQYIEMSPRLLRERQLRGVFLDIDLGEPNTPETATSPPPNDETTPYVLIEQHTYLDLDDDNYPEPYIVTFEWSSGKVLRIAPRFDETGVQYEGKKITKITPLQYFTKFSFVPNPDGSFYDVGFGTLLGPVNEAVNTAINQLIDAGTINNLNGGFLGKGLRLRMGDQGFKPGEWKAVNATGDDLRKQIVPLPSKEPSNVLFQLMGSLITSGKELASVAEIFTGKMPGQNTPATTTMATIEQGMKVFTAVYKRIFRSLAQEFEKIYDLNKTYTNPDTYAAVVDVRIGPDDFNRKNHQIFPGADPTAISQTEKLMKAQGLMELLPTGMLNPVKVISRILEAQEQPNWEDLLADSVKETGQPPAPPPDPKLLEMQMKGQMEQQKIGMQGQAQQHKMELESRDAQVKLAMKAQEHAMDMEHKAQMNHLDAAVADHKQKIFAVEGQQKVIQSALEGKQKLQQGEAEHRMRLKQQAQKPQPKKAK